MKPKARPSLSEPTPPATVPDLASGMAADPRFVDNAEAEAVDGDGDGDGIDADSDGDGIDANGRIVERPDGYHWVTLDGTREFGPFETLLAARADMLAADDDAPEPAQTLQEAERDIGMADWIDPLTGEPAEGQSPPHLDEG